ncbi:MAG: hypothetical protein ABIJ65_04090 [Chloroflexota bacterium]
MNISPTEAEEALEAIQVVMQKTRRYLSNSGAYAFLIVWGAIWLLGFSGSQFLSPQMAGYTWMVLDILGGVISMVIVLRMKKNVRSTNPVTTGTRIGSFWLLLFLFCGAAIWVSQPVDGRQGAMLIILFVMLGWMAMSLLLSFASARWALGLTALALIGYFLLPGIFYAWMAVLGGGGMIALGLTIRSSW